MNTVISIQIKPEEENNQALIKKLIFRKLNEQSVLPPQKENPKVQYIFEKKSIDARHGQIKLNLKFKVYINEEIPEEAKNELPVWKKAESGKSVIIVGSGPAGLFAAFKLLEYGIKPIIIERGSDTKQRKKDIALISTKNEVNEDSNYCFGEGGAGTFSDGKLYTRSNKRGNISSILQIFAHFGADSKILTDAHPHIGTDRLPSIINNMRAEIIKLGGEFHFDTKLIDFIIECESNEKIVKGVKTKNTKDASLKDFVADAVLLCTGHSAPDIYKLIAKISSEALEAKTFAAGVRVEHPRTLIDSIQYKGQIKRLGTAAEYKLVTQVQQRGVYSFCMCPGGFVVPSSSGPNEIVVNGMSSAARNSKWSNAAIVVEIRPEDIPQEFVKKAEENKCLALAGLYYRDFLEKLAKENGQGQAAPSQRLVDFLNNKKSESLPPSSYTPGTYSSNLNSWIPEHINSRLIKAFRDFDKNMKGFISKDALMIAIETRTSTPVRIIRDKETYESISLKKLYPCGEGSGYSGGIVSSAMDGENSAKAISLSLLK